MHKLDNIIQAATISGIFFNNISLLFIINLHLSLNIPNALSTHILVEDWIKFQFVSLSPNHVFHLQIGSLSKASSDMQHLQLIYKVGIYLLYKRARFLSPKKPLSSGNLLPIRIRNPKTYNLIQQFIVV